MTKYVKIIAQGRLEEAPRVIIEPWGFIANPNEDTLAQYGYKPLRVDEKPEAGPGFRVEPHYEDMEDSVVLRWNVIEEAPQTESEEDPTEEPQDEPLEPEVGGGEL